MKWADYCISKVRYDKSRTHIDCVLVRRDLGEEFSVAESFSREKVIEKIAEGKSFLTMRLAIKGWEKGEFVKVVQIGGEKYLKTYANSLSNDNLGELSEY